MNSLFFLCLLFFSVVSFAGDAYSVLGLSPGASLEEIRSARNRLVRKYQAGLIALDKEAGEKLDEIQKAYRFLVEKKKAQPPKISQIIPLQGYDAVDAYAWNFATATFRYDERDHSFLDSRTGMRAIYHLELGKFVTKKGLYFDPQDGTYFDPALNSLVEPAGFCPYHKI